MAIIDPAKLLSSTTHTVPKSLSVTELFFEVPLDHEKPDGKKIELFGRLVKKNVVPIVKPKDPAPELPYLVYFEGGPGFGNLEPQDHGLTSTALDKGYQLLLLDHRGMGLSTPVSTKMLAQVGDVDAQVDYLSRMRQNNVVRDAEAVRKCLTKDLPEDEQQWSIFGHSWGGFISISYLAMHPEGLREVFMTGGLAPVHQDLKEVYSRTFRRTVKRNEEYFQKFPEDAGYLKEIAAHLAEKEGRMTMPAGGELTMARILIMGIAFGGHSGFDQVHAVIFKLATSLRQLGHFSRAALSAVENFVGFDDNIIYAVLHESIYMDKPGKVSNWTAHEVGKVLKGFEWLDAQPVDLGEHDQFYFSGEHIFPLHFDLHDELRPLRDVAAILAAKDDWPELYPGDNLQNNTVPVFAAAYVEDLYVDYDFGRKTAEMIKGIKVFETNVLYHNAIRARPGEVLPHLFALRDEVID